MHDQTAVPVVPILAFLLTFVSPAFHRTGIWRYRTVLAYANDLKPWADLLEYDGVDWHSAGQQQIERFLDLLLSFRSPVTGEFLCAATIKRRITVVGRAYETSTVLGPAGATIKPIDLDKRLWGLDYSPETLSGGEGPRETRRQHAKCMTAEDWELIRSALGPLPSSGPPENRSCRARLEAELALSAGLREHEIAFFPASKVLLDLAALGPGSFVKVRLKRTKGLRRRWVFIPAWLVGELRIYLDGERRAALNAGSRRWGARYVEPATLFVNGTAAGRNAGLPVSPESVAADFRAAVTKAVPMVEASAVIDGNTTTRLIPRYGFHSLRYSFALWLYFILSKLYPGRDNTVIVSARLGHRRRATTDGYLDVGNSLEFFVGDLINEAVKASIYAA